MKFKVVTLMLVALLVLPAVAAPPSRKATTRSTSALDTEKYINANKVLMFINNEGNFAYDAAQIFGKFDGFYYPHSTVDDILNGANDKTVIYDAGMWLGAVDSATGDTLIAVAEYSSEYEPGTMVGGGPNPNPNDPVYRIYTLYSDSLADNPNADYLAWPVSQGAPVDDSGRPAIIGDQMAWTVYNDANPAGADNDAGATDPLGVEIQQTAFAFTREDALGNMVFLKFKLLNKGSKTLQNMFVSLWSDPDLGGASDDLVGCDTALSLGFCYNATNSDSKYGSTPPAVGFDFFQGPLEFTGNSDDTGRMWGQKYPGYRNQPMSSFNKYINGTDPSSKTHTYNYMQGLNRDGSAYTYLGDTLKFFVSGDPVTRTGDLDSDPADRRFMLTTGPFTLRPGDSTEVLAAIVAGTACDRLTAIDAMKYYDRFAQTAYENNFDLPSPPAAPVVSVVQDNEIIGLSWTDLSETDHGNFPFEGYTVLQGPTSSGPWTRIPNGNWDISNGIAVIYDEEFDVANCGVLNKPLKFGSDPGIRRWFTADFDYINGGALNNATEYFFRVEAYSYDPNETPKTLTSATIVKVVPQTPLPSTTLPLELDNIIPTVHAGISDGSVLPQVIDPNLLTGDTYQVYFYDSAGTVYWTLKNVTDNVVVLTTQANQGATADSREDFEFVDGMMVRVYGPAPGMKTGFAGDPDQGWEMLNGARGLTWAGGADGLHMENFEGALGWAANPATDAFFVGLGVGPDRLRNFEIRFGQTDTAGVWTPGDSNISMAYRYGRGFANPPAHPEFGPFIVNPSGGYSYQDFTESVPLSVWDTDANPPRRLTIGFLENNSDSGSVNGRYWPPYFNVISNTSGIGPREWLFIFDQDYSTTADPALQVSSLLSVPTPIMYFATWARRNTNAWPGNVRMAFYTNHINYVTDTFTFVATAPVKVTSGADVLDKVKAVPNPYYLFSSYDRNVLARRMQFTNLPAKCTISIFTLAGDRIAVINKDDASTSLADWDLLTDNQIPLASGIYIYVVDAPGFGQKIGKMAIFTEQEQLDTY
jgi:hypothetical protein